MKRSRGVSSWSSEFSYRLSVLFADKVMAGNKYLLAIFLAC